MIKMYKRFNYIDDMKARYIEHRSRVIETIRNDSYLLIMSFR